MFKATKQFVWVASAFVIAQPAAAQQASLVHRLGRDTVAVEQFTRTANRVVGEVAVRGNQAVTHFHYDVVLDKNGRATSAVYRSRTPAGAPLPNQPSEVRLTFVGDSVRREAVFADSTNTRMLAAVQGTPFAYPSFGLYEIPLSLMRKNKLASSTVALASTGGNQTSAVTLAAGTGDIVSSNTGLVFRVDPQGRIQSLDMTSTTNKIQSTRGNGGLDIAAIARSMSPIGTLSARGNARASFLQSVVFVDYGRPQVRQRTVWGGTLVPFDTIWRAGANEATHLTTTRELTFGNVVVPPGTYTLWIYNSRANGPQLAINRKIGQWGAGPNSYDPALNVGIVPMTFANTPAHVEEYTIAIRPLGPPGARGAIDFAWGDKVATATFVATPNPAAGAANASAPVASGMKGDLVKAVSDLEEKMLALGGALSEAQYAWRPGAGVRSVKEVLLHVSSDNYFLPIGLGMPAPAATKITGTDYAALQAYEKQNLGKAATIADLKASFDHLKKAMAGVPDARMDEKIQMFGQEFTVRSLLILTTTHLHEHLGQMIAYARSNGVKPPWTR